MDVSVRTALLVGLLAILPVAVYSAVGGGVTTLVAAVNVVLIVGSLVVATSEDGVLGNGATTA